MRTTNCEYLCLIVFLLVNPMIMEINLSPYALWNQTGVTVAGWANGTDGSLLTQLYEPFGITITKQDLMYVSDMNNHRITVVDLHSIDNISIIEYGPGRNQSQLYAPSDLFVTNKSLYILDVGNRRIQKTSLNNWNPSTVADLTALNWTYYFFVDKMNNIYVSDTFNCRVVLFVSNSTNFTIVAGTGVLGNNDSQLNIPYGIFVNDVGTIFIADCRNNRIMKWFAGASVGVMIAGTGIAGSSSSHVSYPTQVIVDANQYLYISEAGVSRITRWPPNSSFGVCIAACLGISAISSTSLNAPHSFTFDTNGSLYVSDRYSNRVQKFAIFNYSTNSPSYNQPKLSSCATWNPVAITFANISTVSSGRVTLFVSINNTVYASMGTRQHILVWSKENNTFVYNISIGLSDTYGIFSAINGDIYIDNGDVNGRIDRWSWNTMNSVVVVNVTSRCFSLFIDISGILYCSFTDQHRVARIVLNDGATTQTTIAGNGTGGSSKNMLNYPNGIFLDQNFNLYVADCENHRIQKFLVGQFDGITVAGNGTPGPTTLYYPTSVILDANDYLYICDHDNHRIIRSGPLGFQCIIGCTGINGAATNQLHHPHSISFDSHGNLFVVDSVNNRIQKFLLATNSCAPSYNQPKLSACAIWDPHAITFADHSIVGTYPSTVFVDTNNTVYVVSESFDTFFMWLAGDPNSRINMSDNLVDPHAVFTTINGDIYIDHTTSQQVVERWSTNGTNRVVVMNLSTRCCSLFIDTNDSLYCSLDLEHKVIKISLSHPLDNVIIVAGNGTSSADPNTLSLPNGIFVDEKLHLYVADYGNNRIQRFQSDQLNGTTVVGIAAPGTMALNGPFAVILDTNEYIYVADSNSHIIRSGPLGTKCILGCTGLSGSSSDQLHNPHSLSFDSSGNLFVADMANNRIQKFLLKSNTCVPSYNQPYFCPLASWNFNATTIANQSVIGTDPMYLFIDQNNTLYTAEKSFNRSRISPQGYINSSTTFSTDLSEPIGIFVTLNGDVYVGNGGSDRRVTKWTSSANSSVAVRHLGGSCFGLFVDIDDYLYCSLGYHHKVVKQSLNENDNTTIIVAGNGTAGNLSFLLSGPRGIFIHTNRTLYVADCWNHRIQRFLPGERNGTVVLINGPVTLRCPTAVIMDKDNYLFISEWCNSRILGSGPTGFRCIAGCRDTNGSAANQLFLPHGIAFDSYGNLFVVDTSNDRLQKFSLASNSCSETTTVITESSISTIPSTLGLSTIVYYNSTQSSLNYFLPSCSSPNYIGVNCNVSSRACNILRPCLNDGTCHNTNTTLLGYNCSCMTGFSGGNCQSDKRVCRPDSCHNNGTCHQRSNRTFDCQCAPGWEDENCQTKVNYCSSARCLNGGVCQPSLLNYSCLCLAGSYGGQKCEAAGSRLAILQMISRSFAYVAIIAMSGAALFVVIMDVLKYCFGIDPVDRKRQKKKSGQRKKRKKPVQIIRFRYIHAEIEEPAGHRRDGVENTSV